MMLSDFYICIY